MRFHSTVELGGKTATGIAVPGEVVAALGSGKRPFVRVTVGGHCYRTTVASMDGRFFVPLNADNRSAAGVAAGDEVDVEIVTDTAPREISVPDDTLRPVEPSEQETPVSPDPPSRVDDSRSLRRSEPRICGCTHRRRSSSSGA